MDLSVDLWDPDDWKVGTLRSFDHLRNITALATEPISKLLAIGTVVHRLLSLIARTTSDNRDCRGVCLRLWRPWS
jgi:hypothetical protein